MVGRGFTSEAVSVVFLTLAARSILCVVMQLINVAAKPATLTSWPTGCSSD